VSEFITGWKKLAKLRGKSVTTLWRMVKAGDFPPPVKISPRLRGWSRETLERYDAEQGREVYEWFENRRAKNHCTVRKARKS